jgi:hypothetical protein
MQHSDINEHLREARNYIYSIQNDELDISALYISQAYLTVQFATIRNYRLVFGPSTLFTLFSNQKISQYWSRFAANQYRSCSPNNITNVLFANHY